MHSCTPIFNALTNRDKFCNILRFGRFSYSFVQDNTPLKKLNPFLKILKDALATKYTFSQKISVDESLLIYKKDCVLANISKAKDQDLE